MKCKKRHSLLVEILSILLGINSLIATNGLWVELPLMIPYLPEGWELPAYLTIIIQTANIGPIAYSLAAYRWPNLITEKRAIYLMLSIGLLSSLLIIPFWSSTIWLWGRWRSLALLVLTFFLALVDSTSSIVCLPFMAVLKEHYVTFYMIGEGLGGFLPSMIALAQGVEEYTQCRNVSKWNSTLNVTVYEIQELSKSPLFSPEIFYSFLFLMMLFSSIGFVLLNYLPAALKEHVKHQDSRSSYSVQMEVYKMSEQNEVSKNSQLISDQKQNENIHNIQKHNSTKHLLQNPDEFYTDNLHTDIDNINYKNQPIRKVNRQSKRFHYFLLMFLQGWVSALGYGVFPAIQSYSCLPYGSEIFHLAVVLISTATPLSCVIALLLPTNKIWIVTFLTSLGTVISVYIMMTAAMSPYPLFVGTYLGNILLISSWVLFTGLFGYVKVAIAAISRHFGHRALFWCGVLTQAGSAIGALIMFLLVSVFNLFQEKEAC